MPRVSVIIPVYNASALVGSALASVFAQTFRDFEVIVVDDGSDDEADLLAALAPWRHRITCLRQANGGPARARNVGIAHASGQLIAFLDADDEWMPEKLERQVAYFEQHPETGLLHTGAVGCAADAAVAGPPAAAFCDLFHTRFSINTLTVMVPSAVLKEVGGFDERREIHVEDWDLWLRIAVRYPVGYLSGPLAVYRRGGFMSSQVERTYTSQLLVTRKNADLCAVACAKHRLAPEACLRDRHYALYRDWGYDRLAAGDRTGARQPFGKALACSPSDLRLALKYAATFPGLAWLPALRRRTTAPLPPVAPRPGSVSLVHDTIYRRSRKRVISRLHDLDDALSALRRGKKRVLFDAASPMSLTIFRSVYERIRHDARLEFWFTAHGQVWTPEQIFHPAGITHNVIPSKVASRMKVDLYVNTDFWDMTWLHRRARRMHLFHGVAGKYHLDAPYDLAPTIATFDALLFVNADRRQRYIDAQLVPDDAVKAALVGYPKVDSLVNGSIDGGRIREHLGLSPGVPTVVYAPTWSPYSSLHTDGERLIEGLAAEGLQVIVKLHDRSYDRGRRGSGGIDWDERFARYADHPAIRIVREPDGSPYLAAADAMVSDHSSIAFEFMLLDRPLVVIDRPELLQQAGISPDKVRRLRSAAEVAADAPAAIAAVCSGLLQPTTRSAARTQVAGELFFRPGTATDRAVELLYRLLGLPVLANAHAHSRPAPAIATASCR